MERTLRRTMMGWNGRILALKPTRYRCMQRAAMAADGGSRCRSAGRLCSALHPACGGIGPTSALPLPMTGCWSGQPLSATQPGRLAADGEGRVSNGGRRLHLSACRSRAAQRSRRRSDIHPPAPIQPVGTGISHSAPWARRERRPDSGASLAARAVISSPLFSAVSPYRVGCGSSILLRLPPRRSAL